MTIRTIVSALGFIVIFLAWIMIFRGPSKPPFDISTMAGCYRSSTKDGDRVVISTSGALSFGKQATTVSAYKDKKSLSMLPKAEIVADVYGHLTFADGKPFLLRIDRDNLGFEVPSKDGESPSFRKVGC